MSSWRARVVVTSLAGWSLATAIMPEAMAQADKGATYTAVSVTGGGTIKGVVHLSGAAPAARTLRVTKDTEVCGTSQPADQVQVGPGGTLGGAVVSLVDISRGADFTTTGAAPAIDQKQCRFEPRVVLVQRGTPVSVLNSDPITHNIHTAAFDNRPVNRAQPHGSAKIDLKFPIAEKVRLKCDIHEWMGAWIVVMNHPYYALTERDGSFILKNVPPGTYKLEVWHDVLGTSNQSVSVKPNEVTSASVSLAASSRKP